ncbi:VCBS domain-containing protein, partial [Ensifer sp. LCM 4579]|uniref:VCBS domain-containing protein n=1 Tax=Ensifer sp. LCM 4579 TaxID=1848292 RepID=UPI000A3E883C
YTADNTQSAIQQLGAGQSLTDSFTAVSSDGTNSQIVTVTIHGTNDVPVLSDTTDPAAVVELGNASAQNLAAILGSFSVSDVDVGDTLTASVVGGPTVLLNGSSFTLPAGASALTAAGAFSLTNAVQTSNGGSLAVNYSYDPAAANLDFLKAGDSLTISYTVKVNDGHVDSGTQNVTFTISGTNDAPIIDLNGAAAGTNATLNYTAGAAATAIAPAATVTDVDSTNFNGGSLTVAFTGGTGTTADQLSIQNQGTGAGQIGVSGSSITYGGNVIGTFTGGANGTVLVVTFNANATPTAAQALVDHILYANATSGTTTKTLSFTLNDGGGTALGGADTGSATATINVTGGDTTPPVLLGITVSTPAATNETLTFEFSEVVVGFDANDVILTRTNGASGTITKGIMQFSHTDAQGHTFYTLAITKPNSNTVFTAAVANGSFTDAAGNSGTGLTVTDLKPAGVAGEPINLGLTVPTADDGALVTVTVKDLPAGWTLNGGAQLADGSWQVQTSDVKSLTVTTLATFAGAVVLDMAMSWTGADGAVHTMSIANNVEAYAQGNPIFAWSGDDTLTGSSGADLFVFSQPIGADVVHSFDIAADKIDLIGYAGFASFADVLAHLTEDASGNAVISLGEGQSITLQGVHAASLGAGNFVFDQEPVVNNAATIAIGDGALLPLSGTIDNSGTITLDAHDSLAMLQIIQYGITLQGGGQVILSDSDLNVITGTRASVTLTNFDNTITGAGHIGYGSLTLVNDGKIAATGTHSLEIDTGMNVVINNGMLMSTGSGGLIVRGSVANEGSIWAYGGSIVIEGAVTGSGSAMISGDATLALGAGSSAAINFAASTASMLILGDAFDFTGSISGFDSNDRLSLNIEFRASLELGYAADDGSSGVLTLNDGAHSASIALIGQYDAGGFHIADNGHGGTVITYAPSDWA